MTINKVQFVYNTDDLSSKWNKNLTSRCGLQLCICKTFILFVAFDGKGMKWLLNAGRYKTTSVFHRSFDVSANLTESVFMRKTGRDRGFVTNYGIPYTLAVL